jgi:anthranilate phosphoribosyltransferase
LDTLTKHLAGGENLDEDQVNHAISTLLDSSVTAETKADFLCALARKGETADEIAAFALGLRSHSKTVDLPASRSGLPLLDVVGTGGDSAGTFNISTCVAILCAAAGVPVAKHGNRAATSKCGSADVLEELRIPINLSAAQAVGQFERHGFVFLFAPNFHPAFANVAAARKICAQRGQKTIFNLLGPLLNPARPQAVLAGVPRPSLCEVIAVAMKSVGVSRGMVVCGEVQSSLGSASRQPAFLDEISTAGRTSLCEFYHDRGLFIGSLEPEQFGLERVSLADLAGPGREENARIITAILNGAETGPKRAAVLLNAGAALYIAGAVGTIQDGLEKAEATITAGAAATTLKRLQA